MKELKKNCNLARKETKKPSSKKDQGYVHDELNDLCTNVEESYQSFIELLNSTITFLGGVSDTFDKADIKGVSSISKERVP